MSFSLRGAVPSAVVTLAAKRSAIVESTSQIHGIAVFGVALSASRCADARLFKPTTARFTRSFAPIIRR